MNGSDADRLAMFAASSWVQRGLSADVWAEALADIDAEPEAVELAFRRLRNRSDTPPNVAALRAELRSSSSVTGPPRRDYSDAISLTEYLERAKVSDTNSAAAIERLRRRPPPPPPTTEDT